MNIAEVTDLLTSCMYADDTLLMEGVHGIGKSEIVGTWADENNYHMETLFLSHQDVGDLIGMPRTFEKDGEIITSWTKPIWLQRLDQASEAGKKTIVFLDELNRAPLDVRQSALQLVLERHIHQHSLPTSNDGFRTMVVAATNPAELYQVDEMDHALMDRFCYCYVEADVEGWVNYAKEKKVNRMIIDFILENPTRLHFMPEEGGLEKISASPRSWVKLGKHIDNFDKIPERAHYPVIKGKIGESVGSQFYQFMRNYSKVVKIENVEKVSKAYWKKTKDIEQTALAIAELMENMEAIQKREMVDVLSDKYLVPESETSEDAIPLLAALYSLELEILGAYLKEMAHGDDKKKEQNRKLIKVDFNKNIFRRIERKLDFK